MSEIKLKLIGYDDGKDLYIFESDKGTEFKLKTVKPHIKRILDSEVKTEFKGNMSYMCDINGDWLNEVSAPNKDIKQKTLDVEPKRKLDEKVVESIMKKKNSIMKDNNTFDTLSKIKCNIEKKGKFNYMSWTDAWKEVKKHDPNATYKVYEADDGYPAWIKKDIGAFVKVGVTINGLEHIEHYPVTDNNNISMIQKEYEKQYKNRGGAVTSTVTVAAITSFDINTAIKRAMVKACAYHGLGLYIYCGEDLPEE